MRVLFGHEGTPPHTSFEGSDDEELYCRFILARMERVLECAPWLNDELSVVCDTVCLLVQALFAFASARSGVALRVGEKVYVWRPCRKGHGTGEWVRGSILAFDPVAVAHFVTFERMRPGRVVEHAHDKDDWLQLWRSGECVVASPPPVWTA
jgi:hypothetical protein